jgi:hypothetical protein
LLGAEILASDPRMITVQMIEYIEGGVKEDQTFYLAAFERQRQLTIDLLANLEKIEQQKLRLRTVRNHLTALATQPTLSVQLTEIIQFAQSVEEQVKRQQQK